MCRNEYAKIRSRSHRAVIRVYDEAGNVIETHEHAGRVQRAVSEANKKPPRGEVAPHAPLRKELWLAINKVIHDDDIPVGCSQDAIARRNSDEKNTSCVKPDSQERKASAIGRSGQYILAKQQVTVNIEVFDLRAVVSIHVGEYGAEPRGRRRLCSSRYKEKSFRDVAIQGAEEPLGTERAKERGIDMVDIPKSDRSVCWVDTVGAHLKPSS